MATTSNTVIFYAFIVAIVGFALASIAVWSRRDVRMRLVALMLSLIGAIATWFTFAKLPGKPDNISAEDFRVNYQCASILPYPEIRKEDGIFMLAKKKGQRNSEYLLVEWNLKLAISLQKSIRDAQIYGKGSIIYGNASCKGDGGGVNAEGRGKGVAGTGKGHANMAGILGPEGSEQDKRGGEEFKFYPDPVPPQAEKNYELTDSPLIIPETY